jgi:hypothetical protein
MKASYIPTDAKDFSDVVHLKDCIELALKIARTDESAKIARAKTIERDKHCQNCGAIYVKEVHHIKPMWVYALEMILNCQPNRPTDLRKINSDIFHKRISILECHSLNNLITYCRVCHDQIGASVNQEWRKYFMQNHRIFFNKTKPSAMIALFIK